MGVSARRFARFAVLLLAVPAGRAASAAPAPGIRWAPSIEAGLAEAKERGVPLVVALNMDRERGNEEMVAKVYADPAVVAAAGKCVCTVGSLSSHAEAKDPATGRRVCAKFGSITCDEHCAVETVIRRQWLKKGASEDVDSPQHFFLAPDGRRLFQRTWTLEARELAALMARAGTLCAPATLAAWDTLEGRLQRAADPLAPVRAEAVAALAGMKDAAVDGKLADLARAATDEETACGVVDAFGAAMSPARLALVTPFLSAKQALVRMHATAAVAASRTPDALKAVVAALEREKEGEVRAIQYRAASAWGPGEAAAKSAILAGLKERNPEVLPSVLVALAPWAEDPAVVAPLKVLALGKDLWMVRAAACWTLGGSGHKELAPALRELKDDSRGKRLTAVAVLAAERLGGSYDEAEYRRALKGFLFSRVSLPGDP